MLDEMWLPTLHTNIPRKRDSKLSRLAIMVSQPCNDDSQGTMQPDKASQLIGAAHVVALNFQTIAAANDWWRCPTPDHSIE
jgi:hypothetical protein